MVCKRIELYGEACNTPCGKCNYGIPEPKNGSVILPPEMFNRISDDNARYKAALESIASNACCDGCQEAKKVAQAALVAR